MKRVVTTLSLCLLLASVGHAQHLWQKPNPPKAKAELERIIGPITQNEFERPIKVLWVWGFDQWHRPGAHDYERVRDLMTGLMNEVPQLSVEPVYEFPTSEQWKAADLVCLYLHLPNLIDAQYQDFRDFIDRGGAVVSIHESCIMRPSGDGKKLASCLGRAWNEGQSQWGALFTDMWIDQRHAIFKGFGSSFKLPDEFYWNLQAVEKDVRVIATVPAGPAADSKGPMGKTDLDGKAWPVMWTYQRGKGRVFATSTGHHTFNFYDPEFRIILFRGMAWALREKPDPLMPLVFKGITSPDNMVGTTETMRDWKGKRRGGR